MPSIEVKKQREQEFYEEALGKVVLLGTSLGVSTVVADQVYDFLTYQNISKEVTFLDARYQSLLGADPEFYEHVVSIKEQQMQNIKDQNIMDIDPGVFMMTTAGLVILGLAFANKADMLAQKVAKIISPKLKNKNEPKV